MSAARWLSRPRSVPFIVAATMVLAGVMAVGSPKSAAAATVTYSATQTIPVPPASTYAGSGDGDGWAVALSSTSVYNVFHHSGSLTVACHLQSDASACWSPVTITDANGHQFATSGHPGLWLDQSTGKLYVYATRDDSTGGVVCVDTTQAATSPDPFCGFTALTAVGDAPLGGSISALSEPALIGSRWYAFNYVSGAPISGDQNALLCFDVSAKAACASQPFAVSFGAGNVNVGTFPEPQLAAIGGLVLVTATVDAGDQLSCFDPGVGHTCAGNWPVDVPSYASSDGAPFPLLSSTGTVLGACLPTGADPCYHLDGSGTGTPTGMTSAIPATSGWNGQAFTLGPRVYVPNGNSDEVDCYDASTNASCVNFPKSLPNLGLLYTVNPDPQRPTCVWVNSDDGSEQIQNFDAYTGGACGQGPIRVLASSFVVPTQLCQPSAYTSLQVTSPAPGTYTSGTVSFQDGDANPLPAVPDKTLDATGTVDLSGLNLSTNIGLPQFLITLTGAQGVPSVVTVKLTWTGTDDPSCVKPGTVVTGGTGSINYVALGDSYSSGEGDPPFYPDTSIASDQCHRSYSAYPELLANDAALSISSYISRACSGATSSELEFGFPANHEDGQVSHISGSTNLVTIGVGGDDVGFSDVLKWCITGLHTGASSDCQHLKVPDPNGSGTKITLAQRESILMGNLGEDILCETPNGWVDCQPSLHSIYEDIESRAAVNARVLVLLYPHLFTNSPSSSGCHLAGADGVVASISQANMVWINQGVDQLDAKIVSEVLKAQKDGVNIGYVDPRPAWSDTANNASPGGHGVCAKEPWMNGLKLKTIDKWPFVVPSEYSFHPNVSGQFEFYSAVRGKLR